MRHRFTQILFISVVIVLMLYSTSALEDFSKIPPADRPSNYASHVTSPRPWERENFSMDDIPDSWNWGDVDGVDYLSPIRNQHFPVYCGSCYAHALSSSLADRFNIKSGNRWPVNYLSVQYILNCAPSANCAFGIPDLVHKYAHETDCGTSRFRNSHIFSNLPFNIQTGLVDESCQGYLAIETIPCDAKGTCMRCFNTTKWDDCRAVPEGEYRRFMVDEFGAVFADEDENEKEKHTHSHSKLSMVDKMKAEIYTRGPITVEIATPADFEGLTKNNGSEVYVDKTGSMALDHAVSLVGYGEKDNTPYWLVRNSWGEYWGDRGLMKVIRGVNNIGIETLFWWATPLV